MSDYPSISRSHLSHVTRYHRKKYRMQDNRVLLDGCRLIGQLAESGVQPLELYIGADANPPDWLHPGCEVYRCREDQLSRLGGTRHPQSLCGLYETRMAPWRESALLLYLDGVSDPGNLGTILRTACAFGVAVALSPECCELFNPKVVRASLGAALYHSIRIEPSEWLRASGRRIFISEMNGLDATAWRPPDNSVLVMGSEAFGVSDAVRSLAAESVTVPMPGDMESLNVASAASILLYQATIVKGHA